jgi:pimeloyl-ACP methyl ester carboxylesterase
LERSLFYEYTHDVNNIIARRKLPMSEQQYLPMIKSQFLVDGICIEYEFLPGEGPIIVWLGGYKSDMTSTKAAALMEWGRTNNRSVLRFDYSGHGISGGRFEDGTISKWLNEAIAIINNKAGIAPILVGSSMGGWIAMLAAMHLRSGKLNSAPSALVLIAPATDFTEELMWKAFSPEIKQQIETEGVWQRHSQYSNEPTPVTRSFIEDGRKHLILGKSFELGCKVHILQGMKDPDVPWHHSMRLVDCLPHDQVVMTLINDGDHRLSRDEDIARLVRVVSVI